MKKRILKIAKNLEGSSAFLISPRSFNSCSLYVSINHHPGLSYETIFRNMQKEPPFAIKGGSVVVLFILCWPALW